MAVGRVPRRGLCASDVIVLATMSVYFCMASLYSFRLSCVSVLILGAMSCWCFVMILCFISGLGRENVGLDRCWGGLWCGVLPVLGWRGGCYVLRC